MPSERWMRPAVCDWLIEQGLTPVFEVVTRHTCDIVGVEFAERVARKLPEIRSIVAVELKLDNVAEVLHQCVANQGVIPLAYAAMPKDRVDRMKLTTSIQFIAAGIGLLAVADRAEVIIPAVMQPPPERMPYAGMNLARKLWRRRDEWQKRMTTTKFGKAFKP